MKKISYYLLVVVTIFAVAFVSCKKDNNKDDIRSNPSIIEAKNITGWGLNVVTNVKAIVSNDFEIVASEVQNNSFTLELAEVPNEYLQYVTDKYPDLLNEDLLSDKNAKWNYLELKAYQNFKNHTGNFHLIDENNGIEAFYVYVDREFAIQGMLDGMFDIQLNIYIQRPLQFDCSFKKGWNIMYCLKDNKFTTKETSNMNLNWHFSFSFPWVNFWVYPNDVSYLDLNYYGGHMYFTGGINGVVVYRLTEWDFLAYERACPYECEIPEARVAFEDNGITLKCMKCGTLYNILDGSVITGKSKYPLKQYHTKYDGMRLRVHS